MYKLINFNVDNSLCLVNPYQHSFLITYQMSEQDLSYLLTNVLLNLEKKKQEKESNPTPLKFEMVRSTDKGKRVYLA